MNPEKVLKNPWLLALMLFVISIVISIILSVIFSIFGQSNSTVPSFMGTLAAVLAVGQIYAYNFKEIMPKNLRFNVTLIFIGVQFLLAFIAFLIYLITADNIHKSFLAIMTVVAIILFMIISLAVYYGLGWAGKIYLKKAKTSKPSSNVARIDVHKLGLEDLIAKRRKKKH